MKTRVVRSAIVVTCWTAIACQLVLTTLELWPARAHAGTLYTVTEVGPAGSNAFGINNLGNVVGQFPVGGNTDPFLWTPSGGLQDLGSLGGDSVARAINDNNQVVGQSNGFAFRWTSSTGTVQLDTNPSDARGINNSNVVVGFDVGMHQYPAQWTANNSLGLLFTREFNTGTANGMNLHGDIVGNYTLGSTVGGYFTPVGSIPFEQPAIVANGLSNYILEPFLGISAPLIAGQTTSDHAALAVWATAVTGLFIHIGKLNPSDTFSDAYGVNDHAQVVGESHGTGAFLFTVTGPTTGTLQSLNALLASGSDGWTILSASAINDEGQIVGLGQFDGQQYAVLLNPIPEPSTLALAAVGFIALIAWRLRRARPAAGVVLMAFVACLLFPTTARAQIYVSNGGNGTVGEYSLSGTAINPSLITGLHDPTGLAVFNGNLYVAERSRSTPPPARWSTVRLSTVSITQSAWPSSPSPAHLRWPRWRWSPWPARACAADRLAKSGQQGF